MIRSLLYVPAASQRFIAKAHERGADAIVLDLEDSVTPERKISARAALGDAVPAAGQNGAAVFVRINALPQLTIDDATAACRAGAHALMVPKVRNAAQIKRLARHLDVVEREIGRTQRMLLIPMIETPAALFEARAVAAAGTRVLGLNAGGEDLAAALGAEPTPEVLHLPKLLVHLAAKAAGVLSFGLIRSVADFRDADGIAAAARQARAFGFDGATCIHPSVVPILNEAFAPSAEEAARAQRLIAAAEEAAERGEGAFLIEGRMVDAPVVARARALLSRSQRDYGAAALAAIACKANGK